MRTMILILALLMVAVPIADGAQSFSWTAWTYNTSTDPMTGATVKMAAILSTNQVEFKFPYNGPQRAVLVLRRIVAKDGTYDIQDEGAAFSIQRGQFVCPAGDCRIRIRFDDAPPEWWDVSEPADHSSNVLLFDGAWAFPPKVEKAKTVLIAATVYQEGTPVFTFKVAGLKW